MLIKITKQLKKQSRMHLFFLAISCLISQLKLSIYCKEFLAVHFALDHLAHYVSGAEKPVLVLTDSLSLERFFEAKNIHSSLWNFVDRPLSFNIVVGHIPGKANAAA